ncbi:aminodeoxychorismate lyase [Chromatium okenii]|uniref:aminodeoxychorismate lyase n=1 Tax=Chromatium okenii TaxID=61644 RepID=UPI0026EBFD27|nr:aminodeoxychorismate lyase [Chromatium okenii]MBV5310248.1 aminodeoxychorismate lyase [Chromatium okenii]
MVSIQNTPAAGSDPLRVFIDGRECNCIAVTERGLHYGDGLFETVLLRHGRLCQWQRHCNRLIHGAQRLGIPMPDIAQLVAEMTEIAHGSENGVLKLLLTRGSGGRGYRPPPAPTPHRVLLLYPLSPAPTQSWQTGVIVHYCQTPASVNPALAGIKHLNRLDAVLARREWSDPAISEGLMCDPFGAVISGTMTNIFVWNGERLRTPPVDRSGIAGTRRALTIELAAKFGIDCAESALTPTDLECAVGLFLTNAINGVWPVRELAGQHYALEALPWSLLNAIVLASHAPD